MIRFALFTAFLFSCGGNQSPESSPATVETLDATEITDVSAICKGKITSHGSGAIVKYGIETDNGKGEIKKHQATSISNDLFSVSLTELSPSQKYNYSAYVDDGAVHYGQAKNFTTLEPPEEPIYTVTINTSRITGKSASVSFSSTSQIKEWGFYYNKDEVTDNNKGKKISSTTGSITIGELKQSTLYVIWPFVVNTKGKTVYLEKQSFTTAAIYYNPVINADAPDPSVIRAQDGKFYFYHTGVGIYRSDNLVNWAYMGSAFSSAGKPNWEPGGGVWAPDVNYINGKYVMYYSLSVWGGEQTCGIGIATADKPDGPFTDRGKLFRSNEIGVQNSIDPCYVEDGGKKYLFWGSFRGIYAIELSDDGLALKTDAAKQQVAGTWYEGVLIHKRGGYYYMFASGGSCCEGFNSTYVTVVGRSSNLFGPYVNKSGGKMLDNKHEYLIRGNAYFKGTGHNSEIITDDNGSDWIFYHAYKVGGNANARTGMMDKVTWENDWPAVKNGVPSSESDTPVFH